MKVDRTFLKTRVARRILVLFIFCALVPISALAVISFGQVTAQIREQRQQQLRQTTKALGMSVFERLGFAESELVIFSTGLYESTGAAVYRPAEDYSDRLRRRFMGLSLVTEAERTVPFFGHIQDPKDLSAQEMQHLRAGKAVVRTEKGRDRLLHIYMMRAVDPKAPEQGILYGEINGLYLWGLDETNTLPSMTELCVLDHSDKFIFSTLPLPASLQERLSAESSRSSTGHFEWQYEGSEYLASFWSVFLKFRFFYPGWTVVLSESKDHYFAPIAYFKKLFPLVILLSILIVFLLSFVQVRRTMLPLEELKEGTHWLAKGDLDSRVTVNSSDEFEELAASFNTMASQLEDQFNAMTTMSEIDKAILSTLDTEKIIKTVINRINNFFGYQFIAVTLFDSEGGNAKLTYVGKGRPFGIALVDDIEAAPADIQEINYNKEILLKDVTEGLPLYLTSFVREGIKRFAVVPFFFKGMLKGIIVLGFSDLSEDNHKKLPHVRKLADQVAIALSNAQLIEDLDRLNLGTLTALARTVDAKSPWTAGHTERVTQMAIRIGRALGLTPDEMDKLHKGGLLHDIGKIGVPVSILDKPGKLTDKEFRIIQNHPRTGARILEPIEAYKDITMIVLQHHERFDGKGYPEGLAGEEICYGARILAVADVYDAITSDRPYRKAMGREKAIEIIRQEIGRQFDPDVVEAFWEVLRQQESELAGDETQDRPQGLVHHVLDFPGPAGKAASIRTG